MIELLGAALSGGATGIVGSVIGSVFKFFERKQALKEKQLEFDQELKLLQYQSELKAAENEHELDTVRTQKEYDLVTASYAHDSQTGQASQWVVNILRLVRPVLTLGLIALTGYICYVDFDSVNTDVIYLTTMAVSWWFGDRAQKNKAT